ncbi:MAG: RidA family protein [Candidimonas sp.]|nr:MAG: RidA family protein [Candidimonas sp.]
MNTIKTIERIDPGERFCRAVVHGDTIYLAGVTASVAGDARAQTRDALAKIDHYLEKLGTDKSHLLVVQIWLKDIERDFAGMNAAWSEWIPADAKPARATCEAKLANPGLLVEIIATAAR